MAPILIVPEALEPILEALKKLEPLFHSANAETSTQQFEDLVATEFWEVGASGNRYSREFVLKVLAERLESPEVTLWQTADFHISEVGLDHYLLTYTLTQPGRTTRRASIWRDTPAGWQVIYHQGTVVQGA